MNTLKLSEQFKQHCQNQIKKKNPKHCGFIYFGHKNLEKLYVVHD